MAELGKSEPRNITDKETKIIQAVFNDDLLKQVRALMLELPLTEVEKGSIKSVFADKEVLAVMYKRFYPTLDKDTPIGQVQDTWLGTESMVFGNSLDAITQALGYKKASLAYTKKALELLEDPFGEPVAYVKDYDPVSYPNDPLGITLLARNQYIRHVENQLLFLSIIAKQTVVTPEEAKKKSDKDSAQ